MCQDKLFKNQLISGQIRSSSSDNLRPTLFKICINDLPIYLQTCFDSIKLQYKRLDCLMYADDIVIFSTSANGLQQN